MRDMYVHFARILRRKKDKVATRVVWLNDGNDFILSNRDCETWLSGTEGRVLSRNTKYYKMISIFYLPLSTRRNITPPMCRSPLTLSDFSTCKSVMMTRKFQVLSPTCIILDDFFLNFLSNYWIIYINMHLFLQF